MILSVDKSLKSFEKIDENSFVRLKIWERKHIQEWVRNAPELLGEELLVLSIEFDRFDQSKDRLDVLALDRAGNIVVIELKRDPFAGYADLQAIRYAAMVSSMTIEKVLPYYMDYQRKYLGMASPVKDESEAAINEFVSSEDFQELSNTPRIILCSEDFSPEITTTVLWLNENGLDISCIKITPHDMGDRIVVVPSMIIPLKEAAQYLIDIRKKEDKGRSRKPYRPRSMRLLIENQLLVPGQRIYLKNGLPGYIQYQDGDDRFIAEITGKLGQSDAIKWLHDGKEYAISALTWTLFKDLHPDKKDPGGVNGNWHWVTDTGKNLWQLAQAYWEEHAEANGS